MRIFVFVTYSIGNRCHISPVSPLNPPFNVRIMYCILCWYISSQKYKMTFNNSSVNSSPLSPPQYSIITKSSTSSISFLFSSDFILPQMFFQVFQYCVQRLSRKTKITYCNDSRSLLVSSHETLKPCASDEAGVYHHLYLCFFHSIRPKFKYSRTPNIPMCC